ncbi:MAG: protein-L-isoaspartate O-methyltransferase [Micavibrio sp.]|nr:protein-L-isoaspartate O-methyltransferase [Micavibrio sp.]
MDLRTKGIQDTDVLGALERVPRDHFIPEALADQAYEDIAVPIGLGQTISQPFVVSKMTEALELNDRHKVLEIGTGTGYQACVLSKLCRRVYTIERHKPLHQIAEQNFKDLNIRNITAICADGMKGWPKINGIDQAPFDRIIVTAAAREKPPAELLDQLSVGGIMIAPVGSGEGGTGGQMLKRYKKESEDTYSISDVIPVRFVPLLPDVAKDEDVRESA